MRFSQGKSLRPDRRGAARAALALAGALLACSCAGLSRQPEAGRPNAGPPYPVVLGASEARRDKALAVWSTLLSEQGATPAATAPELQPVTATLRALPATSAPQLLLPRVGDLENRQPTEEETREALRRFITSAAPLLGASPEELSLVERADNGDGTKRARYQQRPFRYPLRGGYGQLEIHFTPAGRITQLSSTAIPEAERIERALTAVRTRATLLTPQMALARLTGRAVSYTDASGREQTLSVPASDQTAVRELVVYPVRRADDPSTLSFHLAWEIATGAAGAPILVYLDAVNGETIDAVPAAAVSTQ